MLFVDSEGAKSTNGLTAALRWTNHRASSVSTVVDRRDAHYTAASVHQLQPFQMTVAARNRAILLSDICN